MDDTDITKAEQVPPHETSASPVELNVAMPRYFGITPPTLLFGIATRTLAIAIVLAILQHWLAAIVLTIAVLLEIALFLSVANREPDTVFARISTRLSTAPATVRRGCWRLRAFAPKRGGGLRRSARAARVDRAPREPAA
jgi:type IV secretory pathway VirB3-like protein